MVHRRVGEKHTTNEGYEVEIIEYFGKEKCTILFCDGTILHNRIYFHIKEGGVKNPNHRTVFSVGFSGQGRHVPTIKRKPTKKYRVWTSMFERCYNNKNPTYAEAFVCEEWHNFQTFGDWFEENYNPDIMEGWELDKDLLIKRNKIYSPETCSFVPKEINTLILKSYKKRGELPIGVRALPSGRYQSRTTNKVYGTFDTPEEAFQAYKIAKEGYIKEVADKWKGQITEEVYQALINYKVEITD